MRSQRAGFIRLICGWKETKTKGGAVSECTAHTQLDGGVVATHPGKRYCAVGIGRVSGSLCEVTEGQPHSFDFFDKNKQREERK